MGILIDSKNETLTSVLGTATHEFVINNAILMQIFIKPVTSSTTYDVSITDVNSTVVFYETDCQGEFNQIVSIPIYGNCTLTITNSSVDENYNCILSFRRS